MYDYCIMIVCNIGPAWRHDCTHEAKPMTTYCTQHFDPYKKTTTGKPTSKMTPKKQPPKAHHGFKFSCQLQSCTKGDSPSFLPRSWWAGPVVGLPGVCIFNNVPLANVSTVAPAPVSGKLTSLLSHYICYSHTHSAKTLVKVVIYQWDI